MPTANSLDRPLAIHHVGLHVRDIEASIEFYVDVLGFEVIARRRSVADYVGEVVGLPGAIVEMAWLRLGQSTVIVELLQYIHPEPRIVSPALPSAGTAHLAVVVADLHAACDRLRLREVNLTGSPTPVTAGVNKGGWAFYFQDPDGFNIELIQLPSSPG